MVTLRINFKEKTILRIKIGEEEKEQKVREISILTKRKELDGKRSIEIDDEEEEHEERAVVKKRKQLDGEEIKYDDHSHPSQSKYLPEDLIEGILKRLAARELIRVEEDNDWNDDVSCMTALGLGATFETVGYCNGLTCIKGQTTDPHYKRGLLTVVKPLRSEQLGLNYACPTGCFYSCCGFGFDPLSQEYKAVVIFASETKEEFACMVFTLGTSSWRTITTTTAEISLPPGSPPFRNPMLSRVSTKTSTLCGGDLFWRVTHHNSSSEMLLLFDLHSEKIQFIRFPTECALTLPPVTVNEHPYLVVDHLLEFKGYPCIARSEKITVSKSVHSEHHCVDQSSFCCCCCKVHMYILKDKVKQVWIKGETFDVEIKDQEGLLPAPLCCYFETTTTSAITPPRTHVLAFSDQVILSWFNGESLIIYNLRKKLLEVVEVSNSYSKYFRNKMNRLGRCIGDDNVYPADMYYQLRAQVENMVPLRTFIP